MVRRTISATTLAFGLACGKQTPATVTPDPAVLDFGAEPIGSHVEGELRLVGSGSVTFGAPGRISGPDAMSFGVSGDEPTGKWPISRAGMMHLYFAPARQGAFTATYTRPMLKGSMAPVTVRGMGSYEFDVTRDLTHQGHYPDGLDFGIVCVGDSTKRDYDVTNNTNRDQRLLFSWQDGDSAFILTGGTVMKPVGAHGNTRWRMRFLPLRPGAVSTGLTVEFTSSHDKRTVLVVKGTGKEC